MLIALVDVPSGPVPERELAAAARRHAPSGLSRPPAELVERLTDHFVRVIPPMSVTWVHPSWRDLVIDRLAADAGARRRFLEHCGLEGVLLALSRGGGTLGQRNRPLLVADSDWDALTERLYDLVPALDDPDLHRLLAVFEDSPLHELRGSDPELVALVSTALRVMASHWARGESSITKTLLGSWYRVAQLLENPPSAPAAPRIYQTPPLPPLRAEPEIPFLPAVDWGSNEAVRGLVDRILADLDAA